MSPELEPYVWTLDEYVLRCEQAGTDLREVVVEGEVDRDVVADAFARWDAAGVMVLDANYIAVSARECEAQGLSRGVRGALLTVAQALEDADEKVSMGANVVIVVDRDYGPCPKNRFLFVTDGHSMESYAFNEKTLDRFVRLLLGRGVLPAGSGGSAVKRRVTVTGQDLYVRLLPASVEISAARLAVGSLNPPAGLLPRWPDYAKVAQNGMIEADPEGLLRNALTSSARSDQCEEALNRFREFEVEVRCDPFRLVRGHDFLRLLMKLLSSSWGRRLTGKAQLARNETGLSRLLYLAGDSGWLDSTGLFTALRARFI